MNDRQPLYPVYSIVNYYDSPFVHLSPPEPPEPRIKVSPYSKFERFRRKKK